MYNLPIEKDDNLENQLNRAQRELSVLYEVSNAMRTTLELKHIMYIILTGVTSHTGLGFNRAILFLVNEEKNCLAAKMALGPESAEHADRIWSGIHASNPNLEDLISPEKLSEVQSSSTLYKSIKKFTIPLDRENQSLLTQALYQGSVSIFSKEKIAQHQDDPLFHVFKTDEFIIVPLKGKDKINGLIIADNIYNRKPITEDDIKIFVMLANQAGLAIDNSQLYERVVQRGHTDSITNLWNHGFFQHTLSTELEIAHAKQQSLTLLMIDIDNFKELNDIHGHQNGDIVLREVAGLLQSSSRDTDYVCRYGGEEFSIILTQTDKEHGFEIAERLRTKISQHQFPKFNSDQELKMTVSIGLSSFPKDVLNKEDLILRADKAMYIAKFGGKNQTCVAEKEDF